MHKIDNKMVRNNLWERRGIVVECEALYQYNRHANNSGSKSVCGE